MAEATESAQITWRLETWFPDLSKDIHVKLRKFYDDLAKANRTTSLISPKTVPLADAIHFADCISALIPIMKEAPTGVDIYDLGSGAGFPGIVAAIMYPTRKFILVDIDDKKNEYLRQCVKILGLPNVAVTTANIEALPANSVKCAIVRGLANISKTILMTRKCIEKGGVLYHMKSENWSMEVGEIPTQLCSVWSPALVGEYRLPIGEVRFAVVKTDKIA